MSTIRLCSRPPCCSPCSLPPSRGADHDARQAAEANLDVLRDTIRANRKALVAVNLKLDRRGGRQVLAASTIATSRRSVRSTIAWSP